MPGSGRLDEAGGARLHSSSMSSGATHVKEKDPPLAALTPPTAASSPGAGRRQRPRRGCGAIRAGLCLCGPLPDDRAARPRRHGRGLAGRRSGAADAGRAEADSLDQPRRRGSGILNEVRLARQITHPAVCRVFDVGEAEGEVFYSMELVQGEDLATLLRRVGRLPSRRSSTSAISSAPDWRPPTRRASCTATSSRPTC